MSGYEFAKILAQRSPESCSSPWIARCCYEEGQLALVRYKCFLHVKEPRDRQISFEGRFAGAETLHTCRYTSDPLPMLTKNT